MLRLRPKVSESSSPKEDEVKLQHAQSNAPKLPTTFYRRYQSAIVLVSLGLGYFIGSRTVPNHVAVVELPGPSDIDIISSANTDARTSSLFPSVNCPPHRTLTTKNLTFPEFVHATLKALDHASKDVTGDIRPIEYLVKNYDKFPSIQNGFWAEFGVFYGSTLRLAEKELRAQETFSGVLAGFDSFEGLPEKWRPDFEEGQFGQQGLYETVRRKLPREVELYKGWFQDTITVFKGKHSEIPAAVIHHDGDLFLSTTITLQLLDDRIHPGTHMIFDELIGYPGFEKHEIFALWLWMEQREGVSLCAMGHSSPIDLSDRAWTSPREDQKPDKQSAWLQVLSSRGS